MLLSWPRALAYRYEIKDLNSKIGIFIPLADIRIGTWVHDIECHPGQDFSGIIKIMQEPATAPP